MEKRKLASIQYIHHITPIEGADRIECVHVLGWQCVANKGQFQVGDNCVYMEVDSFLPICERFEFLRGNSYRNSKLLGEGFRLRTLNFRGQISQGLVQPLSILPQGKYEIGDFPSEIPKTDELRVQSYPALMNEFKNVSEYYISTKMDGTSVTMYCREGQFGVCGRNYEYADDEKCAMWNYAHEHKIKEKLKANNVSDIAIQGEFCGAGIQKNRLKLVRPEWYVFTIIDLKTKRRYSLDAMRELCTKLELSMVPVEEVGSYFTYDSVESLLERARGKYASGENKEGIVIRPTQPVYSATIGGPLSMKVLNNEYLLKD